MEQFNLLPDDSLWTARRMVMEERWGAKGVVCPCCDGLAKVYKRPFNKTMGKILIQMYIWEKKEPGRWHHVKNEWPYQPKTFNSEYARMVDYSLIEAPHDIRPDGNPDTGHHRITRSGVEFVEGRREVTKRQHCYKGQVIGESGPQVNISWVLKRPFNYRELFT